MTILLIAVSGEVQHFEKLLRDAGYGVIVAHTVHAAGELLKTQSPDLLISEIRLGPFNGLHVLIRHQTTHPRMRAIFLDRVYDSVLALEAQRLGATYLSTPVEGTQLLEQVALAVANLSPRRRWPREQPPQELVARINTAPARVVDLSYGGLRLELSATSAVPHELQIAFPRFGKSFTARAVWTHPASVGMLWCGAELSAMSPVAEREWRVLVDTVRASS
jgi:DNA-binding response OmpR family regulator